MANNSPLGYGPFTIFALGYTKGNLASYTGLTVRGQGVSAIAISQLFATGVNQLASGTVTIGGAFITNDTVTVTINGHGVTYTVVAGTAGNNAAIAAAVAAAINADATDGPIVEAQAEGTIVSIQSKTAGVTGQYTLAASKSSTSGTATASGANLVSQTGLAYQSFPNDLTLAQVACRNAGNQNLQAGGGLFIDQSVDNVLIDYLNLLG